MLVDGSRGGRGALLVAVLVLLAIGLGVAGMHASMAEPSMPVPGHAVVGATDHDPPGGMSHHGDAGTECLLMGALCVLGVALLTVLLLLVARTRRLLRRGATVRRLRVLPERLRPPDPPSLLLLSVCRT